MAKSAAEIPKCYNTTGSMCDCICGSQNQGVGAKQAIEKYKRRMAGMDRGLFLFEGK